MLPNSVCAYQYNNQVVRIRRKQKPHGSATGKVKMELWLSAGWAQAISGGWLILELRQSSDEDDFQDIDGNIFRRLRWLAINGDVPIILVGDSLLVDALCCR